MDIRYKVGGFITIINTGGGTGKKDIGLVLKITEINCCVLDNINPFNYDTKVDKTNFGNGNGYLASRCFRLATNEEIINAGYLPQSYELWL